MSETHFRVLLDRYLNDSINAEELPQFLHYLREYKNNLELRDVIHAALADKRFEGIADQSRSEIIFQQIMRQAVLAETPVVPFNEEKVFLPLKRKPLLRWIAAAAILVITLAGSYYMLMRQKAADAVAAIKKTTPELRGDVGPGGNKAILKLADGTSVVLDDAVTGTTIATQGNAQIQKLKSGELAYQKTAEKISIPMFNTITTPRGGQYSVLLPDGSKVWLNAESSLYFPTAFTGKERVVELSGEAYFEIAHNKQMPFIVQVNTMKVEVLGTHFNIMSYDNEPVAHTTLLQGSVKVSFNGQYKSATQLVPGQQASFKTATQTFRVQNVDVESVTAWKNGMFEFNGNDIQTIMRQIERWYDVEVHYAGKIPEGHYSGAVLRKNNLLKVLQIFQETDLRFSIDGKKLTVL